MKTKDFDENIKKRLFALEIGIKIYLSFYYNKNVTKAAIVVIMFIASFSFSKIILQKLFHKNNDFFFFNVIL